MKQMKKTISVLLSLIMALSAFGVLTLTAAAAPITITIAQAGGASFELNVDTEETFGSVKAQIEALKGYAVGLQQLWLPNGIGPHDDELLSERNITDGATLTLEVELPANWVTVYTSANGLEDGALYFDFASVEDTIKVQQKSMALGSLVYDAGIGMNISRSLLDYLRNTFADEWNAAVEQIRSENPGLSENAFDFNGGWPLYEAEDVFYAALTQSEDTVAAALVRINSDLGVELTSLDGIVNEDRDVWETLAYAYLERYHSDLIETAEAEAASTYEALYNADWSLDLNHPNSVQATVNGEPLADASFYTNTLLSTLNVAGAVWAPIAVTDDPSSLNNGDYYLPKAFVEALFSDQIDEIFGENDTLQMFDFEAGGLVTITKDEYLAMQIAAVGAFFLNKTAAADSAFRYKNVVSREYPTGTYTSTSYLPLSERGYSSVLVTAAQLDANVLLYHPEHVYGADGTYIDADTHSLTCTICGDVKTEAHDVIVKGGGAATCGDEGYTGDEFCSVCGQRLSEGTIIPPTGNHQTEIVNAKEATETENGYTGDEVCTVCGKTISTGEVIPATGSNTPDTPDTPDDSGDCPYCGKHHDKIWIKIIHLVLWFFEKVFNVIKK